MLAWRFSEKPDPEGVFVVVSRRAVTFDSSPDAWLALLIGSGTVGGIVELCGEKILRGEPGPVLGARGRRCHCACEMEGTLVEFSVARGVPESTARARPVLFALLVALADDDRQALDKCLTAHLLESADAAP